MAGQTTNLQLPYPTGTDPVVGGDDAMRAIVEALDAGMIPYRMAAGSKTFSISGAASSSAQAVTFTAGRFTMPPLVICWVGNNPSGSLKAVPRITTAVATTGFSLNVFSMDATAVTFSALVVNWVAIQMLPGAAGGGGS